jgi:hypothetical protein
MAEPVPFALVKLVCGIIYASKDVLDRSILYLTESFGPIDHVSTVVDFKFTDYYLKQMGEGLKRKFVSFTQTVLPEKLSEIKIRTNEMEKEIKMEFGSDQRMVNIDPGYMTASALIMATAKDFSHRIALQKGIYAHLELLFGKNEVKILNWTYPDFRTEEYQRFFLEVRKIYLEQLRRSNT